MPVHGRLLYELTGKFKQIPLDLRYFCRYDAELREQEFQEPRTILVVFAKGRSTMQLQRTLRGILTWGILSAQPVADEFGLLWPREDCGDRNPVVRVARTESSQGQ